MRRDTMKYLEEEWNEHLRKIAERNEKERQALMKDLGRNYEPIRH